MNGLGIHNATTIVHFSHQAAPGRRSRGPSTPLEQTFNTATLIISNA